MKKFNKLIKTLIISISIILIIPAMLYLWVSLGIISSSKSKSVDKTFVTSYKTYINSSYTDIKKIDIYYEKGRIYFDFNLREAKTLEEYKDMVLNTRNFILKDNIKELMFKGHDQANISISFVCGQDFYLFESSYYIQSDTPTNDKNNGFIKNNYKKWQYTTDNIEFIKFEL